MKAAKNIDGIVSPKAALKGSVVQPAVKPTPSIVTPSHAKVMDLRPPKRSKRPAATSAASRTLQPSQTLMRHVVKAPSKTHKRQNPAHGPLNSLVATPQASVATKSAAHRVVQDRLQRAHNIVQSKQISRFVSHQPSASLLARPSTLPASAVSVPVADQGIDIFEQAMQRATSHKQPAVHQPKHPRRAKFLARRSTSLIASSLAVILLAGFIGVQNRSNLALRVAASRAGFSATMPGYKPSGFSVGRLNYSAGAVAINFHSNSDDRAFAISEKPSSWNSSTLRDTLVATADSNFQTVAVGGRTVYLYGNSSAAWVNGGVLYQVKTDGSLSNRQLTDLAASL